MFEHHTDPLLPRHLFLLRILGYLALSMALVGAALGIGVIGYHSLGGLSWIDALLRSC